MFDENRATEGCTNACLTPSIDYFLDSPELYEKTCASDTLPRIPAHADWCSGMPACRGTSVVDPSEDESSEVCGGLVPDGEQDLEALLGYIDGDDDRFRTHPAAVVNDFPCDVTATRKRTFEVVEDEEEVESKLCKRQKFHQADICHTLTSPDVSINGACSGVTQPPGDDQVGEDEFCLEHSADELQMLCDDFGFDIPEQECSSCSPDEGGESVSCGSARHSRRQKIKETVKMLREAIPGAECMDTAIVLDEAINYVKLLQLQVQALGAQRLGQR